MTIEQIKDMTLTEMKVVAKGLGINGYQSFTTRAKIFAKIEDEVQALGLQELPNFIEEEKETIEEEVGHASGPNKVKVGQRTLIRDFPRRTVTVSARDPQIKYYDFSVNEYSVRIQMETKMSLPLQIIEHIKSLTEISYEKDGTNVKHVEKQKFFVNYT